MADSIHVLYNRLGESYDRMGTLLEIPEARATRVVPDVSGWSVAQQVHHVAVSNALMLTAVGRILDCEAPAAEGGKPNMAGRAVLMGGRMPRGRAKAPARAAAPESVSQADAARAVTRSRDTYDGIQGRLDEAVTASWRVEHPYLGWLGAGQWLRLAAIHSNHHFLIVSDILSASGAGR